MRAAVEQLERDLKEEKAEKARLRASIITIQPHFEEATAALRWLDPVAEEYEGLVREHAQLPPGDRIRMTRAVVLSAGRPGMTG